MKYKIITWIESFFYKTNEFGISQFDYELFDGMKPYITLGLLISVTIISYFLWFGTRIILLTVLHTLTAKTKTKFDDYLVEKKVFGALAHLCPLIVLYWSLSIVFYYYPSLGSWLSNYIVDILIIITVMRVTNRTLSAFQKYLRDFEKYDDKPIESYIQIIKIVLGIFFILMILSQLTGESVLSFFAYFGALSAIVILVFKDTILGFVGSIQLSANDMIRKGDWITMEKYGADGDIEEINLNTVKVRNFDKTITTIPTYSFISDSFKNWRGMAESSGRRIKRSIYIEVDSIHFASDELVHKFENRSFLKDFLNERKEEINKHNEASGLTDKMHKRRFTNLGLFRFYIEFYLRHNDNINKDMTLIVRQLQPTEKGMPIEIYCFSKTKDWGPYENIISDIFDHLYAVIPEFDLSAFEYPSGKDLQSLKLNE